ncbi:MAG: hypothetical protein JO332_05810, partial [Planctomycetaceae bacterium]|nr:hypothetical protein [Planctomycetaceae bacterium]
MQRRTLVALALTALALPVWAQDKPATDEKKLTFKMKDASVDAVLQYVSSVTGWIFVQEKPTSGTISAVSDTDVPLSKVLDFLNSALRPHGRVILNPYSPALPTAGQTLKVLDVSDAMKRGFEIYVGADVDSIPLTDQVRTQIVPLKAVNVIDVQKELGELLRSALTGTADGTSGSMAVSTYSNSIILTGRSEGISRAVRILKVIDVSTSAELKIKVFPLKNADATETAKTLNDVFKKETMKGETGNANPMSNIWRMFGGGGPGGGRGERGEGGAGGPSPRALAHEMVRITAEVRTNSVIVSATEDNMKIIEDLILRLDDKSAAAIKLKLYVLRYADSTGVAKLVNDLFAETPTNSQGGRGNNRGGGMMPMWMGGAVGGAANDPQGATKEVRAVADVRTNSVLVAASEQRLVLIDAVMTEIDRQVNDLLEVKIYKLQNADPTQMATVLQALFRPQITATQNSGRSSGGGGNNQNLGMFGFAGGGGNRGGGGGSAGSALLPSQEVEITADTRTRAVIAKASKEYIAIIDDVVKQLDQDPTETVSTYVIPLRNADASSLALTLQNLLRSSQTGSGSSLNSQFNQNRNQQNTGPFSGMQQNGNTFGTNSTRSSGSTRGSGGSSGRFGNLGPLEGPPQEAPAPGAAQDDDGEPRRGIEGQADIQPDTTTNSLVIRTSPRNFQSIQGLLRDLDRMRPQVLIKVLIADVTLDDNTQFGVEGFWEHQVTPSHSGSALSKYSTSFPLGTSGLTYALTADNGKYQATLNLFASEGRLKVLATPRIMVLDNQTANINIGKDVPRITNSTINSLGNAVNSVTYESVGVILNVTPHINPDGLVTMVVAPEISDVASQAEAVPITDTVTSPTFNVNRAQTTVAVRNGTTVVLGG